MAKILAVLTSGRKQGFTAGILEKAIEGIKSKQVDVDYVWLPQYTINPCNGCFSCIRNSEHYCIQNDDMGQKGEGRLYRKILDSNAIIIADPVYFWGSSSRAQVFFERLYQYIWSGVLNGLPFASISCASNQGMMREASRDICKRAFQLKFRYVDNLPVHLTFYDEALKQAYFLGTELAQEALNDKQNRRSMTDEECFMYYSDTPWRPLELYIDNLTNGSSLWQDSIPYKALSQDRFKNRDATIALEKCVSSLRQTLTQYRWNNYESATKSLVKTAAYWAEATWKEFLETVIQSEKPKAYRSIDQLEPNEQ
jgi:multimeric flavodoxin WrbA